MTTIPSTAGGVDAAQIVASDVTILSSKRAVYVGGLSESVTPQLLRAAMIPFGDILSVDIPMDYAIGKHRGFGFVEYNDPDDAAEAIFNMDGGDLMGKTLRVSVAQPNQLHKLGISRGGGDGGGGKASSLPSSQQAVWSNDEWFQQHAGGGSNGNNEQAQKEQKVKQDDQQILTEAMTTSS